MIQKVISAAVAELGYLEGINNSNKFAPIVGHKNNQAWCASFVCACFKIAGEENAILNTPSVLMMVEWAKKNLAIIPVESAKRGDLICLNFKNNKENAEHIEIAIHDFDSKNHQIQTIGGNTGNTNQINGEGVFKKTRSAAFICCVIRPRWSNQ